MATARSCSNCQQSVCKVTQSLSGVCHGSAFAESEATIGGRRALINMESRASLNSSTSDVPTTNWKAAPREPATPTIMNLHLRAGRHQHCRTSNYAAAEPLSIEHRDGGRRGEGAETMGGPAGLAGVVGSAARKVPDAATTATTGDSRMWRHSASFSSRARRELVRDLQPGNCQAWCCTR